jgi:hypothetical protein
VSSSIQVMTHPDGPRVNICVFLPAADLDDCYTRPAREFAQLLRKGGHTLVWGGSDVGLMKVVADSAHEAGGRRGNRVHEVLVGKQRPQRSRIRMHKQPFGNASSGTAATGRWRRRTSRIRTRRTASGCRLLYQGGQDVVPAVACECVGSERDCRVGCLCRVRKDL